MGTYFFVSIYSICFYAGMPLLFELLLRTIYTSSKAETSSFSSLFFNYTSSYSFMSLSRSLSTQASSRRFIFFINSSFALFFSIMLIARTLNLILPSFTMSSFFSLYSFFSFLSSILLITSSIRSAISHGGSNCWP